MAALLDQNLIRVSITDDGSEVVLTLVEAGLVPRKTIVRCKEVVVLEWHRTLSDRTPYIIPEITWNEVEGEAIPRLLEEHAYPFSDSDGTVWHRFPHPLVHLKIEGAVCADIICASVDEELVSGTAQQLAGGRG